MSINPNALEAFYLTGKRTYATRDDAARTLAELGDVEDLSIAYAVERLETGRWVVSAREADGYLVGILP